MTALGTTYPKSLYHENGRSAQAKNAAHEEQLQAQGYQFDKPVPVVEEVILPPEVELAQLKDEHARIIATFNHSWNNIQEHVKGLGEENEQLRKVVSVKVPELEAKVAALTAENENLKGTVAALTAENEVLRSKSDDKPAKKK